MAEYDDIFESLARELLDASHDETPSEAPAAAAAAASAIPVATAPDARSTGSLLAPEQSRITAPAESIAENAEIVRYEDDTRELETDTEHFAKILPTTFGLSGSLSGVAFNESELIKHVAPFLKYPCIRAVCNDGMVSVPDFDEIIARFGVDLASNRRNERSREKKRTRTRAKPRKVRGTGTSFDSSILFWIHSAQFGSIYKIRLFRNGHFGLPGTKPEMIRDIIAVRDEIFIPLIARILQAAGNLPDLPDIRANGLVPIMKNYKWRRIMAPGTILNLGLICERMRAPAPPYAESPFHIHYAQYTPGESKLSVSFATPTEARESKAIRVNIFQSGKINILGAHVSTATKKICEYLAHVIDDSAIALPSGNDSDETEESEEESRDLAQVLDAVARDAELRELIDDTWLTTAIRRCV